MCMLGCDCLCMFGSSVLLPGHLHNVLKQELLHRERQTRDVDHWTVVCGFDTGKWVYDKEPVNLQYAINAVIWWVAYQNI